MAQDAVLEIDGEYLLMLNKQTARYFSSTMDLFQNNKELQFRTWTVMVNHLQVQRKEIKACEKEM